MKAALAETLLARRQAGESLALVTDLESGAQNLLGAKIGDLTLSPAEAEVAAAAWQAGRAGLLPGLARSLFVEIWHPPLRLALIGAVHIAQALAPMAALAGYQVTIIDPRSPFLTAERFPHVSRIADWPDTALAEWRPDGRSAIVTLSHDPKIDDPGLIAALASPAFYVAALGSRRTQAQRLARLAAAGLDESSLARIHGPAGLAIGALSPAEIAVSILAEMTQRLHQPPRSLGATP